MGENGQTKESNWADKKKKLSLLLDKTRTIDNRSGQVRNAICGAPEKLAGTKKSLRQEISKESFNSFFDHTLEEVHECLDAILSDLNQIS